MGLFDAESAACAFFENWLADEKAGKAARDYLAKRGFTGDTIKLFRVGLAVESWDALLKSPAVRKFPPGVLAMAGLLKPRQTGDALGSRIGGYGTCRGERSERDR